MKEKPQTTAKTQVVPPQITPTAVQVPAVSTTNGFAITSLVLGIVSIVFCWIPFAAFGGQIVPILGFIFGLIGMNERYQTGRGMAIAGLVMSIIAFVVESIWVILFIIGAVAGSVK